MLMTLPPESPPDTTSKDMPSDAATPPIEYAMLTLNVPNGHAPTIGLTENSSPSLVGM